MKVEPKEVRVRSAERHDWEAIEPLYLESFPASENRRVGALAKDLFSCRNSIGFLSLVALFRGDVVGHIAFSPVRLESDVRQGGSILAPLVVAPKVQRQGVGTILVELGFARLADWGTEIVFVYGDPAYYGRFGFSSGAAEDFQPEYTLRYPFGWQAKPLAPHFRSDGVCRITCVDALRDPTLW